MAKSNDITTRFTVDISDLKANIQEANRTIKLANSEFKAASAGMENWSQSTDGLSAKLKQLNTVHDAELKKLDSLKKQYDLVVHEQGQNSKAAQDLMVKINNQQAAVSKIEKSINQYNAKLDELTTSNNQVQTATQRLTNEINDQEAELNQLKTKYKDVILSQGDASDEAKRLASQITNLSEDLQKNKIKMSNADEAADKLSRALDKTENEAKQTNKSFTLMDGVLSGLISNGISNASGKIMEFVGSLFELGEATEEYRSMMAKIEGSANSFGYSIDFAKGQYKEFYGYLKDDQMATNAITNLMGMKLSTEGVSKAADAAIAVWSAYGDSIPIESLTESINESAQVAKVTGTLADTINWAKRSNDEWSDALSSNKKAQKAFNDAIAEGEAQEDAYSAALAACSDTQERATLIANTLNKTYGKSKKTYDKLAGSLIDANKAELELKETQAELADTLAPLQTQFTLLQNQALKKLSPAIEDVSNEFMYLIDDIDWDGATDVIGDLLETTVEGLKFVVKNIEPIMTSVKAMGAAWATYKATQLAVNGVTKASNALLAITTTATTASTSATVANTVATKGATIATKALNLAQKANPWGLVASLIASATVALVSWAKSAVKAARKADENAVATDKIVEAQKRLNEKLKESKKSREEAIDSAQAEIQSADIMLDRLDELAKKENKSNAEKQMMKYYVDQLNKVMPDLNLQYDAEKNALNMSTDAIRNNITATKELMLAKAAQENLATITQDLAAAEIQMSDAAIQHAKNAQALTNIEKEATDARLKWINAGSKMHGEEYDAMTKASLAHMKAQENFNKSKEAVDHAEKSIKKLNKEFETTEKYAKEKLDLAELNKSLNSIIEQAKVKGIKVPQAIADGIREGKFALPTSIEEMKALITYNDLVTKASDAGLTVPKTISNGISTGKMLPSKAAAQMQSLVDFTDLLKKSNIAGKKVPQYIQDQIISGKLKPADAVQMMKDLVQYNDLVKRSTKAGMDVPEAIKNQIKSGQMKPKDAVQYMKDLIAYQDMLNKAKSAGVNVPESIKKGVNSGQTKPRDAINQINNLMTAAANSSAQPMSVAGSNAGQKYASGVGSKSGNARSQGKNLASNAKSGAESIDATPSGQYFGQGFVNGIGSMFRGAIDAAASLARKALNAIKNVGKEGSPWKTTIQSGKWAGEGLAIGLEKSGKIVNKSASKLVGDTVSTLQDVSKDVTIGDMLRMNEMKAGLSTNIRNLKSKSMPVKSQQVEPIVNQYFTQNNYSPKPLSRLEIYRNTKAALKASKGGK